MPLGREARRAAPSAGRIHARPPRSGFTLVEVLIGAVVLLVGFLPVYLFLAGGERDAEETAREVEALALASSLLDDLAAIPLRHLPEVPRMDAEDFIAALPRTLEKAVAPLSPELAGRFDRSVEIRAGTRARRIAVVVRAKGGSGPRREAADARLEALVYE